MRYVALLVKPISHNLLAFLTSFFSVFNYNGNSYAFLISSYVGILFDHCFDTVNQEANHGEISTCAEDSRPVHAHWALWGGNQSESEGGVSEVRRRSLPCWCRSGSSTSWVMSPHWSTTTPHVSILVQNQ